MMKCIVVDDEPLALDLLEDYISKVSFLQLVKKCKSAVEAIDILQKEKIDLLFLDIQMPDMSGIQLLKSLQNNPMVIFTTAYDHYALEGFDLDVLDYLLKPVPFDRFMKAVNKANEQFNLKEKATAPDVEQEGNFLFVKSDYKMVKINLDEIQYIEGLKDYIKIYTAAPKPVLTLQSLKAIEERLPSANFIRVHRSYIVSLKKIDAIRRNHILIVDKEIPVGDLYKEAFFKIVNEYNL